MSRQGVGEFEQLVLLAILRLGHEAYGGSIAEEIEVQARRSVAQAAVYVTLRRLERKGWVTSHTESDPATGSQRARRIYAVLPECLDRLRESRMELLRMWDGVGELGA